MRVVDSISGFQQEHRQCVATIGKYDGMHLGHQRILQRLKEEAAELELPAVVILSEPQPQEFFTPDQAPARLNHFWDKVEFLREYGLDMVLRLNFTRELSEYSPERFIEEYLVQGLGLGSLVVGADFRFGRDRGGDLALLRDYGERAGFRVHAEAAQYSRGERISSTLVRKYLREDNLTRARELLGRDYSIAGEVTRGRQLGRQLGTPTANLGIDTRNLPFTGIYAVRVLLREREFAGVANIGFRPTVEDTRIPSLEVYLFDFNDDLYGAWLKVSFLHKLRDEVKFDGLEALKRQIDLDVEQARAYFRQQEAVGG